MILHSAMLKNRLLQISASLLLSACAVTQAPAPVESRTPAAPIAPLADAATETPTTPMARPGYHIVRRGDTVYSIALEYGQYHRDVAAWNSLDNPNLILVGQELRVLPPNVADVPAVADSPIIEARPIDLGMPALPPSTAASMPAASPASAPVAGAALKQEPRGGRIAYSDSAWKALQSGPVAAPKPLASAPVAASTPAVTASAPVVAPPTKPAPDDGGMGWAWPVPGRVLAGFNESSNKGIDLAGNIGDPVLAAAGGRVLYAGNALRGFGNLVIIRHNGNYQSVYAHNSEILVKEGQTVQKGQKIAALGNSDADRPKLHFEIRREGKPLDPMKFLPAR